MGNQELLISVLSKKKPANAGFYGYVLTVLVNSHGKTHLYVGFSSQVITVCSCF